MGQATSFLYLLLSCATISEIWVAGMCEVEPCAFSSEEILKATYPVISIILKHANVQQDDWVGKQSQSVTKDFIESDGYLTVMIFDGR